MQHIAPLPNGATPDDIGCATSAKVVLDSGHHVAEHTLFLEF